MANNPTFTVGVEFQPVGMENLYAKVQQAVAKSPPLKLSVDSRGMAPLGRITADVNQFDKSMQAAFARVTAFGASLAIINSVSNGFKSMVKSTIEVEKSLIEINSLLKISDAELNKFGNSLFSIARGTSTTFKDVGVAAGEFARQGLSVAETLKRTNDAMMLSRLAGMGVKESVEDLTAAYNGFNKSGLTTTDIINRFTAVANKFAVSERDLADGFGRVSSTAQDAGVSFNELAGLITAVQQKTARGGAVIGNALNTIFSRTMQKTTIESLQDLGVQVDENMNGIQKLKAITEAVDNASARGNTTVANSIMELTGGVRQMNIVSSALKDLGNQYGVFQGAINAANGSNGDAVQRINALNQSMDALAKQGMNNVQQAMSGFGKIALGSNVNIKGGLNLFKNVTEGFAKTLNAPQGESIGTDFAQGIAKGVANVLSGPILIAGARAMTKILVDSSKYGMDVFKQLTGIGTASQNYLTTLKQISGVLNENQILQIKMESDINGEAAAEAMVLKILREKLQLQAAYNAGLEIAASAAVRGGMIGGSVRRAAGGLIPAVSSEYQAISSGVGGARASDKAIFIPNFSFGSHKGPVVINSGEKIVENFAGGNASAVFNRDMIKNVGGIDALSKMGKVRSFPTGYIPNFANPLNVVAPGGQSYITAGGKFAANPEGVKNFKEIGLSLSSSLGDAFKKAEQLAIQEKVISEYKAKQLEYIQKEISANQAQLKILQQRQQAGKTLPTPIVPSVPPFLSPGQIITGETRRASPDALAQLNQRVGGRTSPIEISQSAATSKAQSQQKIKYLAGSLTQTMSHLVETGMTLDAAQEKVRQSSLKGLKGAERAAMNQALNKVNLDKLLDQEAAVMGAKAKQMEKMNQKEAAIASASAKAKKQMESNAKWSQRGFYASIAASMAQPFIEQMPGATGKIGSGIASGVSIGGMFGMPGLIGGAAIGGGYGIMKAFDDAENKLASISKNFEKINEEANQASQSLDKYLPLQEQLNQLISSAGDNAANIQSTVESITDLLTTLNNPELAAKLKSAGTREEREKIIGEVRKENDKRVLLSSLPDVAQKGYVASTNIFDRLRNKVFGNKMGNEINPDIAFKIEKDFIPISKLLGENFAKLAFKTRDLNDSQYELINNRLKEVSTTQDFLHVLKLLGIDGEEINQVADVLEKIPRGARDAAGSMELYLSALRDSQKTAEEIKTSTISDYNQRLRMRGVANLFTDAASTRETYRMERNFGLDMSKSRTSLALQTPYLQPKEITNYERTLSILEINNKRLMSERSATSGLRGGMNDFLTGARGTDLTKNSALINAVKDMDISKIKELMPEPSKLAGFEDQTRSVYAGLIKSLLDYETAVNEARNAQESETTVLEDLISIKNHEIELSKNLSFMGGTNVLSSPQRGINSAFYKSMEGVNSYYGMSKRQEYAQFVSNRQESLGTGFKTSTSDVNAVKRSMMESQLYTYKQMGVNADTYQMAESIAANLQTKFKGTTVDVLALNEEIQKFKQNLDNLAESNPFANITYGLKEMMNTWKENSKSDSKFIADTFGNAAQEISAGFGHSVASTIQNFKQLKADGESLMGALGNSIRSMLSNAFASIGEQMLTRSIQSGLGAAFGGKAGGGTVGTFAFGGKVPAMVMGGEYKVDPQHVRLLGSDFWEKVNRGQINFEKGIPKGSGPIMGGSQMQDDIFGNFDAGSYIVSRRGVSSAGGLNNIDNFIKRIEGKKISHAAWGLDTSSLGASGASQLGTANFSMNNSGLSGGVGAGGGAAAAAPAGGFSMGSMAGPLIGIAMSVISALLFKPKKPKVIAPEAQGHNPLRLSLQEGDVGLSSEHTGMTYSSYATGGEMDGFGGISFNDNSMLGSAINPAFGGRGGAPMSISTRESDAPFSIANLPQASIRAALTQKLSSGVIERIINNKTTNNNSLIRENNFSNRTLQGYANGGSIVSNSIIHNLTGGNSSIITRAGGGMVTPLIFRDGGGVNYSSLHNASFSNNVSYGGTPTIMRAGGGAITPIILRQGGGTNYSSVYNSSHIMRLADGGMTDVPMTVDANGNPAAPTAPMIISAGGGDLINKSSQSSGGGINVTINVTVNGGGGGGGVEGETVSTAMAGSASVAAVKQAEQTAQRIKAAVRQVLAEEKTPGGMLRSNQP